MLIVMPPVLFLPVLTPIHFRMYAVHVSDMELQEFGPLSVQFNNALAR